MARRYNRQDIEGEERPTSGPISLTNFFKPQPQTGRKKNNKSWRPMQLSDLGDHHNYRNSGHTDFGDDDLSSLADSLSNPVDLGPAHPVASRPRASPFDLPPLQTDFSLNVSPLPRLQSVHPEDESGNDAVSTLLGENSSDISPTNTRFEVVEHYARLFGKQLPDPIRLTEEMGTSDGQITFIGHPNRDVSAHQWSSSSFQWVNIGIYSHNRRRIEGSLASDRLRIVGVLHHTIEYFKAVAEQREINIRENGRPEEHPPLDPPSNTCTEELRRSVQTNSERVTTLSNTSDSTNEQVPIAPQTNLPEATPPVGSQGIVSALRTVTRDYLEDPFVTPAKATHPAVSTALNLRSSGAGVVGSMNFDMEFPTKAAASQSISLNERPTDAVAQKLFIQRERERLDMIRKGMNPREHEPRSNLREVDFGEEGMSGLGSAAGHNTINRQPNPMSPEEFHSRQVLKNKLAELGDSDRHFKLPIEARVAIPDVPSLQGTARALFPPPGLTVANPHRVVSTLNANAAPYKQISTYTHIYEDTESEVTTVNAAPTANLQYSDPDGMRTAHVHEIANGLGHQAPTAQNFDGPFFAETMPTTHDPTTSLFVQINDKEKLVNWFRDGQRPARQQEYAKTLMATALTSSRTRKTKNLGAIGDTFLRPKDHSKYENTPALVRLYENLYEYVEDSRGPDYFTRTWKPAQNHHRDLNPDGNNSFYSDSYKSSPQGHRIPHMGFQSFGRPTWGGFGLLNSSTTANRFSHGIGLDAPFGGLIPSRH